MSDKEIVYIDGEPEEVELKPITLFYGYTYKLDVPQAAVVDMSQAMSIANNVHEEDIKAANQSPIFRSCFKAVLRDNVYSLPKTLGEFHGEGSGVKSVFVMVMLTLNAIVQNASLFSKGKLKIHIKYPETCLHPREQANLGDLIIKLSLGRFHEIQEEFDIGDY